MERSMNMRTHGDMILPSRDPRAVGDPRMYGELAAWFHLVTAPADYADEAAEIVRLLADHGVPLGARSARRYGVPGRGWLGW